MDTIRKREEADFVEHFDSITEDRWRALARHVSQPHIADRLIERAMLTPYTHLPDYMDRWWLFNPFPAQSDGEGREFEDLASVRIHHILRADFDRHMHNHPWNARTIILRGWYIEERVEGLYKRLTGDTTDIRANVFHTIREVSPGGVWTMFFCGKWTHPWGFRCDDGFVPWREYLCIPKGDGG